MKFSLSEGNILKVTIPEALRIIADAMQDGLIESFELEVDSGIERNQKLGLITSGIVKIRLNAKFKNIEKYKIIEHKIAMLNKCFGGTWVN